MLTTASTFEALKFDEEISTEYRPAAKSWTEYDPSPFVVVSRVKLVPRFTTLTLAPEITAPLGSVTVPLIVPVAPCPQAKAEKSIKKAPLAKILFVNIVSLRKEK